MPSSPTGNPPKEGASPRSATGRRGEKVAPAKAVKPMAQLAKPASNRAERAAERRAAIIEAALDEFIARGFTATRLDDIASRAGVAKGTIYLHFKDKELMFEELIRTAHRAAGRPHARAAAAGRIGPRCDRGLCADLHPGSRDHAARRHRPPDRRGGAAVSRHRRFLLSRSGVARPCRHARADRARHRARRDPAQGPGALSADHGGAGDDRGDLAEPVQPGMRRWMRSKCFASISI